MKRKIREAVKKTSKMYEEIGLTNEEKAIVSRCCWIAAEAVIQQERVREDAEQLLSDNMRTAKDDVLKWLPSIMSTVAVVISIICIILKLLR